MALVTFPAASFVLVGTAFDWATSPAISRTLTLGGVSVTGSSTFTGNLTSNGTANSLESLGIKSGSNKSSGTVALVAGTMTIANTRITAGSIVLLNIQADGGVPGDVRVSSRVASTSFSITSSSALDTSIVGWVLVEPT